MKFLIVLLALSFSGISSADSCREIDGQDYWFGKKSKSAIQGIATDLALTVAEEKCRELNGVVTKIVKVKKLGCSRECARKNNYRASCSSWEYQCSSRAVVRCCSKFKR